MHKIPDPIIISKILNQTADPVFILSPDFIFEWANKAYCDYMQLDFDQIVSKKLDRVIPAEYSPILKRKYKKITSASPMFDNVYPSALSDGSIIIEKWHNEGVFNPEGELQYYYCIASLNEKHTDSGFEYNKSDLVSNTLIRSSLLGIIVTIDDSISYINRKTWDVFGLTAEEIPENLKLADFFKRIMPEYNGRLLKPKSSASTVSDEILFTHPNGNDCWVSIIRKPQNFNTIAADLILVEDITERKLNEIETEAAKKRLAAVMRIAKVGYWEKDFINNRWIWSNETYDIFELPHGTIVTEELIRSYMDEDTIRDRDDRIFSILKSRRGYSSHRFEYRININNGKHKWISGEAYFVRGSSNKILYGWSQDVTERKDIEEALRAAKEKAEESERLKTAFIANMSHEIRTPLNAILGFSDLLTRNPSAEEHDRFKQIIKQSSNLLLNIIDDILDISTIEAGKIELNIEKIAVIELFRMINTIFSDRTTDRLRLIIEDPEDNLSVRADHGRLKQVLINLINNAFKYTDRGQITVRCIKNTENNTAEFTVKDTGIGIAPEKQKHIFERFYQVNNFSKGTGLGLAISRSLLEQMDGAISVKSVPGRGSEFIFTLPLM